VARNRIRCLWRGLRALLSRCQRAKGPGRTNPPRLDRLMFTDPCLAAIRRSIGAPEESIGSDIVVPDLPQRRLVGRDPELLLDLHLGADATARADVLDTVACIETYQLPAIERAIVVAQRCGHVHGVAVIAENPVFVEDLPSFKTHGAPQPAKLPVLLALCRELPVAEQVIEVSLVRVVRRTHLLRAALHGRLRRYRRGCDRGNQDSGTYRDADVVHDRPPLLCWMTGDPAPRQARTAEGPSLIQTE